MASESSAVIQFIADNQRRPVDRGIFSRKYAPPAIPVLMPLVASRWKPRLMIGAALLLFGVVSGLYAGQTDLGRRFIASLASTQADLASTRPAPAPPAAAPAAAIAPCAPAAPAPAPVAAVTPATAPPPAPRAPVVTPPPAAPALAIATPVALVDSEKARPRRQGTLRIATKPACDIHIDGRKTGLRTPQRALKLKPGKHTITLVNKKLKIRKKLSVRIEEGKTTRVTKDLRRKKR